MDRTNLEIGDFEIERDEAIHRLDQAMAYARDVVAPEREMLEMEISRLRAERDASLADNARLRALCSDLAEQALCHGETVSHMFISSYEDWFEELDLDGPDCTMEEYEAAVKNWKGRPALAQSNPEQGGEVIDHGRPGSDYTAEVEANMDEGGALHIQSVKTYPAGE